MNCATEYCTNEAKRGRFCFKCISRKRRAKNPIKAAYFSLREHAKERFINFSVTWKYWVEFCERTRYHELKGTGADDMSIDRPDSLRGYADDNIEMRTVRYNSIKQHGEDAKQRRQKMAEEIKQEYGGETPF